MQKCNGASTEFKRAMHKHGKKVISTVADINYPLLSTLTDRYVCEDYSTFPRCILDGAVALPKETSNNTLLRVGRDGALSYREYITNNTNGSADNFRSPYRCVSESRDIVGVGVVLSKIRCSGSWSGMVVAV